MNFEDIKQRLLVLDTACVCDGNKAGRAADPTIPELRVIDPADCHWSSVAINVYFGTTSSIYPPCQDEERRRLL